MTDIMDKPKKVREGEELDAASLERYLKANISGLSGSLEIQQFPSGFSNLTYFIKCGDREMVLRRPPFGSKVKSAHDMGREHRVLSALHEAYPAPKPLVFCEDESVVGSEFYVMERIRGVILRGNKPEGFEVSPDLPGKSARALIKNLADLHTLDYEKVGLGDMRKEGSYVKRQVEGWTKRYKGSQTDDIPTIDETATWLHDNMPEDVGACIIHNDYKYDNVVLDPNDLTKIIGVLDWEMCTIGDPLMDLGTTLGYWNEQQDPSFGIVQCFLTLEPGAPGRKEIAAYYAELTGRDLSNINFYYVFALLKLAVIVQQIYYRYKQGLTKDERFAPLIFMVGALGQKATEVIETGEM